jgi:hypothetical protein
MALTQDERESVERRILEIRKVLVASPNTCGSDLLAEMTGLRTELDRDLQI